MTSFLSDVLLRFPNLNDLNGRESYNDKNRL